MFPRSSMEFYLVLSSMYNEGHLIILIFCKHVHRKLPAGTELSMCYITFHYKVKTNKVKKRKEENVLFNDTVITFYLRLYGVRHGK